MRKFLISATLLASTLAIAAPAAAQWTLSYGNQYGGQYGNQYGGQYGNQYGNQYGGQYGNQYGNAYGYNNNRGQVRALMVRLNHLERQIHQLDRRNILSEREAHRLQHETNQIERRLRQASYNGLNGYEARDIHMRIARLEQNIRYQASDGNRYANRGYGAYGNAYDRDHDGRDDRYEDDRGRDNDDD